MQNFLLYKTSPLLGGQMKYDIVLESSSIPMSDEGLICNRFLEELKNIDYEKK